MTLSIADLYQNTPSADITEFSISGWVRTVRDSKAFGFIELNDGTSCQKPAACAGGRQNRGLRRRTENHAGQRNPRHRHTGDDPRHAAALRAEGAVRGSGRALRSHVSAAKEAPSSFEYLRTIAHLRPRTNAYSAVFRIRSLTAQIIHQFFHERGFVYVHTPIITASDCEGAGEMFQVTTLDVGNPPKTEQGDVDYTQDFFKKQANLTVSGQLNVETFCLAFRNVYTFGPTFRAEISYTQRHAAEFWMIEPEIAFADLFDDMALAEEMIKYVITHVLQEAPNEMKFFEQLRGKGADREADLACRQRVCALHLYRCHRDFRKLRRAV